jgi:hypothetical protein
LELGHPFLSAHRKFGGPSALSMLLPQLSA